jgi:CspA family cold shock protein
MNLPGKLFISLVIAVIASITLSWLQDESIPNLMSLLLFVAATVTVALLPAASSSPATAQPERAPATSQEKSAVATGEREQGKVKWFNGTKGFGFIVKDDGEEIFVHFRSIRGAGRRGLRDGQRVSFAVVQSDKGPQADDVEVVAA